jgi:hypothetical protein
MDMRAEARSRRDDAANSSRRVFPPACTEVTAAAERVYTGRTKVACAGGGTAIARPPDSQGDPPRPRAFGPARLQITRHTMPSNFRANSFKTKERYHD